jgi:hypothetical protein
MIDSYFLLILWFYCYSCILFSLFLALCLDYALERTHLSLFFLNIFSRICVLNYFIYLFLATALLDCSSFVYICFLFTHPHLKISIFHLLFISLIYNLCSSVEYDLPNVLPTLPLLLLFSSVLLNTIFILIILKLHYAFLRNFLLNVHDPFPRLLPLI